MINLDELLVQARRIAEHRRADAEKDIRKTYKQISKELQHFLSDTYVRLSKDGKLTWDVMQQNNEYARFLEEITQLVDVATPQTQKVVEQLVDDMYKASYQAMMDGVKKASGMPNALNSEFANAKIQPQQIKAAVDNPVSGLTLSDTLEKHRKISFTKLKGKSALDYKTETAIRRWRNESRGPSMETIGKRCESSEQKRTVYRKKEIWMPHQMWIALCSVSNPECAWPKRGEPVKTNACGHNTALRRHTDGRQKLAEKQIMSKWRT